MSFFVFISFVSLFFCCLLPSINPPIHPSLLPLLFYSFSPLFLSFTFFHYFPTYHLSYLPIFTSFFYPLFKYNLLIVAFVHSFSFYNIDTGYKGSYIYTFFNLTCLRIKISTNTAYISTINYFRKSQKQAKLPETSVEARSYLPH